MVLEEEGCTMIVSGEPTSEAVNYTEDKVNFSCYSKSPILLVAMKQKLDLIRWVIYKNQITKILGSKKS